MASVAFEDNTEQKIIAWGCGEFSPEDWTCRIQ
ncbi:Uncharacterised protein [Yersinia pekkanenii]|uniref:Uncharacterized protein n=1 Tax=Yersinia pekkanenii TaxID=1288385 RepID=A0A0T9Q3B8_9GAMM|nr:Uncharacterised protein [Yersinia pekkanenii]CRY68514.1 Uncharacterised protein [Yersinia pekkanenii]